MSNDEGRKKLNDEKVKNIYDEINGKDMIKGNELDRELLNDIIIKMCEICDYYWDNVISKYIKLKEISEAGEKRNRQMYERSILCYKIINNESFPEPATKDTVLSIVASVYAFMSMIEKSYGRDAEHHCENIFTDSNFYNTIGLCSNFKWNNKRITDKKKIAYYKCLGIKDGQPFSSKYWFLINLI